MTNLACVLHGRRDLRIEERPPATVREGDVVVDVAIGGICGSDLHYFHDGSVGDYVVREPLVLGHEMVGRVAESASSSSTVTPGLAVAIYPATPCGQCRECLSGRPNICAEVRYLGSAARTPHVQGGFCQQVTVPASQIRLLPPSLTLERAVLAEPLAVALHAVKRAGSVAGKRVLVTGAGPIGLLVIAALRASGAADVIAVDLVEAALAVAGRVGADRTYVASDTLEIPEVDIAIEASGSDKALATCVRAVRRGGVVVQLGLLPPGLVALLGNTIVTRELDLRGSFRFDAEFDDALEMLNEGLPVDGIVTHSFPLTQAAEAFAIAGDRKISSKVLISFDAT